MGPRPRLAFVNHLRLDLPTETSPLRSGSIGIWNFEVATRVARSFDVTVYSPRSEADRLEPRRYRDVEFVAVPIRAEERVARVLRALRRLPGVRDDPRRPAFASRLYWAGFARRIGDDIRRRGCAFAYVSNFSQFLPILRARHPPLRLGLHMQCEWLTQLDPRIVGPRLDLCDVIGGCSRYVTDAVARRFPRLADRCFPLHNGVDADLFRPVGQSEPRTTPRSPHVLFVGRLSPEKGVHDLLEAFLAVSARFPDARLTLIGGIVPAPAEYIVPLSEDPQVRALARFYEAGPAGYEALLRRSIPAHLQGDVRIRGDVPQARLAEEYRSADVFVFPSVWNEPFGMPIAEAMASGVPVVATRGGGIPEFVEHGREGFLVERGDPRALGEAIGSLLGDAGMRVRMGRAGRERVERELSWDRIAAQIEARFEALLAGEAPPGRTERRAS